MTERRDILAKNLADVRSRIAEACLRRQRNPADVRLVAVTKTAPLDDIANLISLGQTDLGENRPQQLRQRADALPDTVAWHMIGHLQRNKIDILWPCARWIHSVDSLRLLQALARQAKLTSASPCVLLEVNVSGETSKGGFAPDELLARWSEIAEVSSPAITGLMTMAPLTNDPETARPVFRRLRELRDRLRDIPGVGLALPELSMGMSGDFEMAVEEGATLVRVGSRLFEGAA